MTHTTTLRLLAASLALAIPAAFAAPATPAPFTATYQVSQDGQVIGEATVTLKSVGNGLWEYDNQMHGTAGIAAAFGANSTEVTRLRWVHGAPETVSYDYRLQAAIKTKQRHIDVDPANGQVTIDEGKGPSTYAGAPGLVDRNSTPLAIGLALRSGSQAVTLPVAVRRNVENQQFKVTGSEAVQVPAGHYQAEKIERSDADKAFTAWYAPQKYPVPVKFAQSDGGGLEMALVSYHQP